MLANSHFCIFGDVFCVLHFINKDYKIFPVDIFKLLLINLRFLDAALPITAKVAVILKLDLMNTQISHL